MEVQLGARGKKLAFKKWQSEGTEEAHEQYREKKKGRQISSVNLFS